MKKVYLNVVLINILFAIISYFFLPVQVANHFGSQGVPHAYIAKGGYLLFNLVLSIFMGVFYYYLPDWIVRMPKKFVSLPNRDYWLEEVNKARTKIVLSKFIYECGTVLFGFLLFCGVLGLIANLSSPVRLNETALFIGLGLFIVYITYWCVIFVKFFNQK